MASYNSFRSTFSLAGTTPTIIAASVRSKGRITGDYEKVERDARQRPTLANSGTRWNSVTA